MERLDQEKSGERVLKFGESSRNIHKLLTIDQLQELMRVRDGLKRNENFVERVLERLTLNADLCPTGY